MDQPRPDFAPHTITFAKVRERLTRTPFEPFRLVTSSGKSYDVPTSDHGGTLGVARTILVARDDGASIEIPALHITAIEPLPKRRRRTA
jgi:hypothetical protein